MNKIDLLGLDNANSKLLLSSYESILKIAKTVIIVDSYGLKEEIFQKLSLSSVLPSRGKITIKNLFEIESKNGVYYIAQVEGDYRYVYGNKYGLHDYGMEYNVFGIAKINPNRYGNICVKPIEVSDNKIVKFLKKYFDRTQIIDNNLNKKYCIEVSDFDKAKLFFKKNIIEAIDKSRNFDLIINKDLMVAGFSEKMNNSHTNILCNLFSNTDLD
jgi:hypothetical protein